MDYGQAPGAVIGGGIGVTETAGLESGIGEGDEAAISSAYDSYFDSLVEFVFHVTYDFESARDIAQDAFLKTVGASSKRRVRDFKAYLYKTARNMAFDELKKLKRRSGYPVETVREQDPNIFSDPERASLLSEQRAVVAATTSRMNEHQRTALTLRDVEGWSYNDIAEFMEMSRAAVGVLLSRARLKFRKEFRMQAVDPDNLSEHCRNLLGLMSAGIDGELSDSERLDLHAHLEACPECSGVMNEMATASTALRSYVPLAPLLALKAGVVAKAVGIAGAGAVGAGVAAGAGAGAGAGMTAAVKALIGVVSAVLIAGAGIGTYIGVTKTGLGGANPYVRCVSPADGERLEREPDSEGRYPVQIIMEVDNEPSRVELSVDGQTVATLERGPYHYTYRTDRAGSHTVLPTAFDADGRAYAGDEITFVLAGVEAARDLAFEREAQIWSVGRSGGDPVQLTTDGLNGYPEVSPDGELIVFHRSEAAATGEGSSFERGAAKGIYTMSVDGTGVELVTPEPWLTETGWEPLFEVRPNTRWIRRDCLEPSFSPDGSSITFVVEDVAYEEEGTSRGNYHTVALATMSLEEGAVPDIILRGDDLFSAQAFRSPRFSGDAASVYFGYSGGGGPPAVQVERVGADGTGRTVIAGVAYDEANQELTGYFGPDVSPDDGTLALVRWENTPGGLLGTLCLAAPDGSGVRAIETGLNVEPDRIAFSPDGGSVAFSVIEGESQVLYAVGVDGSDLTRLTEGAEPGW